MEHDFEIPRSAAHAQQMLSKCGLPSLNRPLLKRLADLEGDRFTHTLGRVAAGMDTDTDGAGTLYLRSVITAVVPRTMDVIRSIDDLAPSLETVFAVAKQQGRVFGESIKVLAQGNADAEAVAAARRYIAGLFRKGVPQPCQPAGNEHASLRDDRYTNSVPPSVGLVTQLPLRAPSPSAHPAQTGAPGAVREFPRAETRNTEADAEGDDRRFQSFHLYGGKAAMCFSADETRPPRIRKTVRIEAALSLQARQYDWSKKVSFQLTVSELSLVLGVLLGYRDKVELQGHGVENEKSFTIENQGDKFFLSLRVRDGGVFAIPVLPKDTILIMGLLFLQLRANMIGTSESFTMTAIRRVCEMTPSRDARARAAG